MTGSFVLSMAMLFSFLALIDFVGYLMPQSAAAEDFSIMAQDGTNIIPGSIIDQLRAIDGVENVFARRNDLDQPAVWIHDGTLTPETIDLISYDDFDLDALAKDGALRSGASLEKVKNSQSGVLAAPDQDSPWKVGDKIDINGHQVTIEGLLKYDPFSADGQFPFRTVGRTDQAAGGAGMRDPGYTGSENIRYISGFYFLRSYFSWGDPARFGP